MTSSPLRTCAPAVSASRLFEDLGYEIDPVEVDISAWRAAGLDLSLSPGDGLHHCGRVGEVEFLSLRSTDSDAPRRVLESYRAFNRILRPLVIVEREPNLTEVWGRTERGRIGRLDVPDCHRSGEVQRRLELLSRRSEGDLATRVEVALSRESVSDRFFKGFSEAVGSIERELMTQAIEREDARSWAVLFLSRILFLSFIQEKLWLDGDRDFLVSRALAPIRNGSVFGSFLQPLFFDCLNVRRSSRTAKAKRLGRIPYLNGGLFRRSRLEETHGDLTLSDPLVGSIITDVFARFPFTIREDDQSLVAIDPEMLGHVFESLMEEDDRVRSGSFYTPKPIVDHLVERALRLWIARVVPTLDNHRDPQERPLEASGRAAVLETLREVTVLDPACGSGAFLLAAMKEIERLRRRFGDESAPETLRQEIVERSLFGVDLKREAVQLCELRVWLAIVASRPGGLESIEAIQPLPNLDRNILQGNSLLDPIAFSAARRPSMYRSWNREVRKRTELIASYRHATGRRREGLYADLRESDVGLGRALIARALDFERRDLSVLESQGNLFDGAKKSRCVTTVQQRITELENDLSQLRNGEVDFFSFDLHFSPVMDGGGFDLVFGNPPWVRGSNLSATFRKTLLERFEWLRALPDRPRGAFPQFELSVLFLEKAASITHPNGVVSMLVPGKILKAYYAERCRRELESNCSVLAIDDWSRDRNLFDADTFPIGLTFTPERLPCQTEVTRDGKTWSVAREDLRFSERSPGWSLLPKPVRDRFEEIWNSYPSLGQVLGRSPVMGIKTGANRMFFPEGLDVSERGGLTAEGVLVPWNALTRSVRGRDVRRWKAAASTWMLWPEEPAREAWKQSYADSHGVEPGRLRLAYVRPEHLGWKVAWKDVATQIEAVVLPDTVQILGRPVPLLPNQTLYCLDAASIDETYLLAAMLNSTITSTLARAIAEPAKDGRYRFFGRTIADLPWPALEPSSSTGRRLVRLSRAAHAGEEVQEEIDRVMAGLYGVSEDELDDLARAI